MKTKNVTDWACTGCLRCGCSQGAVAVLWGHILYGWRADCLGLMCSCVTGSFGSLVVQEGEPGASSCWLSSLALGSSWLPSSGWLRAPGHGFQEPRVLKGLGSCCCVRAGTGLSWDPLCSFLISCSTQCPRALALTAVPGLFLIPGCSSVPGRSEDGSGDEPDTGASAVYHGLRVLWQSPDQRHVLRVL